MIPWPAVIPAFLVGVFVGLVGTLWLFRRER